MSSGWAAPPPCSRYPVARTASTCRTASRRPASSSRSTRRAGWCSPGAGPTTPPSRPGPRAWSSRCAPSRTAPASCSAITTARAGRHTSAGSSCAPPAAIPAPIPTPDVSARPGRDAGEVVLGDALLGGQPAQQAGQLDALIPGQRGADLVLMTVPRGAHLAQLVAALRGQVQRVGAAVGGVAPPFDQAALFELVDQEDHPGGVEPEQLADGLLGLPLVGGQPEQQPGMPRLEVERCEPLAELPRHVEAELHQQVGEVLLARTLAFIHLWRLSHQEYSHAAKPLQLEISAGRRDAAQTETR